MPDTILGCIHRSIACKAHGIILASCATQSRLYLEYGITSAVFRVKKYRDQSEPVSRKITRLMRDLEDVPR